MDGKKSNSHGHWKNTQRRMKKKKKKKRLQKYINKKFRSRGDHCQHQLRLQPGSSTEGARRRRRCSRPTLPGPPLPPPRPRPRPRLCPAIPGPAAFPFAPPGPGSALPFPGRAFSLRSSRPGPRLCPAIPRPCLLPSLLPARPRLSPAFPRPCRFSLRCSRPGAACGCPAGRRQQRCGAVRAAEAQPRVWRRWRRCWRRRGRSTSATASAASRGTS